MKNTSEFLHTGIFQWFCLLFKNFLRRIPSLLPVVASEFCYGYFPIFQTWSFRTKNYVHVASYKEGDNTTQTETRMSKIIEDGPTWHVFLKHHQKKQIVRKVQLKMHLLQV